MGVAVVKKTASAVDPKAAKVELVPIDSIKLWKENPRRNDQAVPRLAELIKIHGQRSPIVCWTKNRVIYKGNTTWKAMKSLGMKTIRVQWEDFPSEQAAVAYGIADNKSSEFSEWDVDLLSEMMNTDVDNVATTGFTEDEKRNMSFMPDLEKISKINAENTGMKDKIIVMVMDAAKVYDVKEALKLWIKSSGLKDIEVK
jgi:hypothetical protein